MADNDSWWKDEEGKCTHKFTHFDTNKAQRYDGRYNTEWTRTDRFFCERCLEYRDKVQQETTRDKPNWY